MCCFTAPAWMPWTASARRPSAIVAIGLPIDGESSMIASLSGFHSGDARGSDQHGDHRGGRRPEEDHGSVGVLVQPAARGMTTGASVKSASMLSDRRPVMATAAVDRQQQTSAWWIFLLQGIAAILLGLMLLTNPGATLVALTTFLGFYLLITGVLALVRVFVDRSTSRLWSVLSGIVGILAGVFVLNHPLLAAVTVPALLIIVLGFEALSMGVFEIIRGFQGGGVGAFILGVINALIGLLLLVRPMGAALAVPFVLAMLLLIEGVGLLIWAFRARA
jgi:uncharacterized membrane protein HdeD (DUF308 family)